MFRRLQLRGLESRSYKELLQELWLDSYLHVYEELCGREIWCIETHIKMPWKAHQNDTYLYIPVLVVHVWQILPSETMEKGHISNSSAAEALCQLTALTRCSLKKTGKTLNISLPCSLLLGCSPPPSKVAHTNPDLLWLLLKSWASDVNCYMGC